MWHKALRIAGADGLDDLLGLRHTEFPASRSFNHKIEKQEGRHAEAMRHHQGEKVIRDEHGVLRHMRGQSQGFALTLAQVVIL